MEKLRNGEMKDIGSEESDKNERIDSASDQRSFDRSVGQQIWTKAWRMRGLMTRFLGHAATRG